MKSKTLQHQDQLISYQVQHKPAVKRHIHLRAAPDGSLMVIAPQRMSKRSIHKALQERVHKVAQFLAGALEKLQELPRYNYSNGEEHLYLGQPRRLEVLFARGRQNEVRFSDGIIRVHTADDSARVIQIKLEAWYRKQAAENFGARIEAIARNVTWTGGKTPAFRLRKMKRTWGSCSASGMITLNPRLIKAPQACIDYVIAHE
jgi:predicted metal-dependent hydrolase